MGWIAKDSILGLVGDCLYNSNGVERGVAGFVVKVIEFYTLRGKGFDLVPLSMPRSSSIIFTVTLSNLDISREYLAVTGLQFDNGHFH